MYDFYFSEGKHPEQKANKENVFAQLKDNSHKTLDFIAIDFETATSVLQVQISMNIFVIWIM